MERENKFPYRDIKTKKAWRRMVPAAVLAKPIVSGTGSVPYSPGINFFEVVTQAEFLAEYYPSSHRINSEVAYPDIVRVVSEREIDPVTGDYAIDETGAFITKEQTYYELVPRFAFPFQQIIAFTHIYHATANDVQHELAIPDPTEEQDMLFDRMCAEWHAKRMENAWYKSFKSIEVTAESAFVGAIDSDGKFCWRVLSFMEDDIIYPHYDYSGRLRVLARETNQFSSNNDVCSTLEVWDDKKYRIFQSGGNGESSDVVIKCCDGMEFCITGYELVYEANHGFSRIPVAYRRNEDGPGWSGSQDAIDNYEMAFSQMAHNNQAYGEAILVTKSKSEMPVDITRGLNGTIKQIDMDSESDAHFLEGQSASDSYMTQLEKNEEMIYRGSEIIKSPTELKSGDTPATSIKLLFTPNMQRAESDLNECSSYLSDMWRIFAEGYGIENNCVTEAVSLPVISWGIPFVPQSESAITADLVSLVNSKIISAQTAAERCPFYSKPGETKKIELEQKRKRDAELLVEIEQIKATQTAKASQNNTAKDEEQEPANNEQV